MPLQGVYYLPLFSVSVDAESLAGFLSRQVDSFNRRPDAFAMLRIIRKDVYVNDVFIPALPKMIEPLPV